MAESKKALARQVGEYTGLAMLLPASTLVGYVLGYLLDKLFGTHFLYIVFLLFGIAGGLVKIIQQFTRDTENDGRG